MIENLSGQVQKGLWLMEDFGDLRPEFEIFRDFTEPGEEQRNPWDRLMGYYGWEWLIARKRIVSIAPVICRIFLLADQPRSELPHRPNIAASSALTD